MFSTFQPSDEIEAHCSPTFPTFGRHLLYDSMQETNLSNLFNYEHMCNLETSFAPSSTSLSSTGSPMSQKCSHLCEAGGQVSPETSGSSLMTRSSTVEEVNNLRYKLMELENEMLGSDSDNFGIYSSSFPGENNIINSPEISNWRNIMEIIHRGDLRLVLTACAKAISDDDTLTVDWLKAELRQKVSVYGEPIKRLGAYMLEGLLARYSGTTICQKPPSNKLLSSMHTLFEVCPYFRFGCMSANGAIAEAMRYENRVHIIDFQIAQETQWVVLLHGFASRPGGPPYIRITGTYDPSSTSLNAPSREPSVVVGVRKKLLEVAKLVNVPFEFQAVPMSGSDIKPEQLGVRPGEALAVNFAFMLHHMSDESVNTQNHRDRLLRLVKSLSPKVVTMVEQESNTNTAPFFPRFLETLDYYTAVFESIDISIPRDHKERIHIEQHCLARDIVNIIACEGDRRVERHELLGKWKLRFSMAGFIPCPLNSYVNSTIRGILLQNYNPNFKIQERDGALYLGWKDRDLVAICAWK